MRVRMKVAVSGTRDGQAWPEPGEALAVADDEGMALCAAGMAEPVNDADADVETATPPEPETRKPATRKAAG